MKQRDFNLQVGDVTEEQEPNTMDRDIKEQGGREVYDEETGEIDTGRWGQLMWSSARGYNCQSQPLTQEESKFKTGDVLIEKIVTEYLHEEVMCASLTRSEKAGLEKLRNASTYL